MRILACLFLFIGFSTEASDKVRTNRIDYIAKYKDDAIREMQISGVPASITIAQACLESSDGNSNLAIQANNHFGIKCSNWTGDSFIQDDDTRDECFRKYPTIFDSYRDHSEFLRTRPRYAFLFELDPRDYKGWARGLKKAGYATDPRYADRLIKIIEEHQLYLLDEGKTPPMIADAGDPQKKEVQQAEKFQKRVYVPAVEVVDAFSARRIQENNGVSYIIVRKGDTFQSLAKEFELGHWQLPKYNEMEPGVPLQEGQMLYIKPKKKDNPAGRYTAKSGDTLFSIAHEHGIKLKNLCKYNGLTPEQAVQPGTQLKLKKS